MDTTLWNNRVGQKNVEKEDEEAGVEALGATSVLLADSQMSEGKLETRKRKTYRKRMLERKQRLRRLEENSRRESKVPSRMERQVSEEPESKISMVCCQTNMVLKPKKKAENFQLEEEDFPDLSVWKVQAGVNGMPYLEAMSEDDEYEYDFDEICGWMQNYSVALELAIFTTDVDFCGDYNINDLMCTYEYFHYRRVEVLSSTQAACDERRVNVEDSLDFNLWRLCFSNVLAEIYLQSYIEDPDEFFYLQAGEEEPPAKRVKSETSGERSNMDNFILGVDAIMLLTPFSMPEVSESGLSDLLLFARGLLGAKDLSSVRLAVLHLINAAQKRFGHSVFADEVNHLFYTKIVPLFGKSFEERENIVVQSDVKSPVYDAYMKYTDKITETYSDYMKKGMEGCLSPLPTLPEWNSDWDVYASTFRHSKLFSTMMDFVKYVTAFFALLTFIDKDKAKEMMSSIVGAKWFDSIKLVGSGALVSLGLFAIYKEVMNVYVRHKIGEPIFELDPIVVLNRRIDSLIAKVSDDPNEVMLDTVGSRVISTRLTIECELIAMQLRKLEMKVCVGSGRPDLRKHIVDLNAKFNKVRLVILEDFDVTKSVRFEPWVYTFKGAPGIGKSILLTIMHEVLGEALGLPTARQYIYFLNVFSKYDDTFKKLMWHVVFDDYGATNPEADPEAARNLLKLINVVNSVENPAVKADVDSKGKLNIHPTVVGITCNNPCPAIEAVLMEPYAIFRRMGVIIKPFLRDCFRDPTNRERLWYDKYASCCESGEFPEGHPWFFTIEEYYRTGDGNIGLQPCNKPGTQINDYSFAEMLEECRRRALLKVRGRVDAIHADTRKCEFCGDYKYNHVELCLYDKRKQATEDFVPDVVEVQAGPTPAGYTEEDVNSFASVTRKKQREVRMYMDRLRTTRGVNSLRVREHIDDLKEKIISGFYSAAVQVVGFNERVLNRMKAANVVRYSFIERIVALFFYLMMTILLFDMRIHDGGFSLNVLSSILGVILVIYYVFGYGYFSIFVLVVIACVYVYAVERRELDEDIVTNVRNVNYEIFMTGRVSVKDKWTIFKFADPRAASIILNTSKVIGVVLASMLVYNMFKKAERPMIQFVEERPTKVILEEEVEKKKVIERVAWSLPIVGAAVATAGYFAYKSRYPEPQIEDLLKSITLLFHIIVDGEVSNTFTGFRYRECAYLPKHGVNAWRKAGYFNDKKECTLVIETMTSAKAKPIIKLIVRVEDLICDEFDFVGLRVSQFWGAQPKKLDELFLDAPANVSLNLVGMDGKMYSAKRDKFLKLKFVKSSGAVAVNNLNGGWFAKPIYKNVDGIRTFDYYFEDGETTEMGDCHAPVMAVYGGKPMVMGVHTQMTKKESGNIGGAYVVTKSLLDKLHDVIMKGSPLISLPVVPPTEIEILADVHPKCRVNTIDIPLDVMPIGQVASNYRPKATSAVQHTKVHELFAEDLEKLGVEYGPPNMQSGLTPDGKWETPYDSVLGAMQPCVNIPEKDFIRGTVEYSEDVKEGFSKEEFNKAFPDGPGRIKLFEALNGTKNGSVRAMNFKSSAGRFFKGKKSDYLIDDDVLTLEYGRPCYKLNPIVQEEYNRKVVMLEKGEQFSSSVSSHLKDEIRVKGKKARVFYIGEFVDFILTRQAFAQILWMMEQSRQFTECYVGTNCASTAWKEMEQNLRRNGIKLFTDKDFKNFDILQKRLYLVIMLDYFYLDLARFLGFSDEDMKLVYMVGVSDLFTYVNLNGDVILTAGTNFSGGFRTTGQNCAFNSILHRVVFYALTSYYFQQIGVKKPRYRDYCNLATFGDDSLEGISDKVALYYNFAKFKEYLLKYGILVTPARKSEGDYDFKKLEDCQFLKRSFVHDIVVDSEGGAHDVVLAPLEMTSVLKPLVFQVRSKSVTSEIQTIAAIMSVNRELWMHGRGAFDKYHGKLQAAKVILGDETLLETFDEISNMYLAGDYSTQET